LVTLCRRKEGAEKTAYPTAAVNDIWDIAVDFGLYEHTLEVL
jgi:hypothetical protein